MEKESYYKFILANVGKLLESPRNTITVDQFDDMYAGFFGVWGNFSDEGKPTLIEELSPMGVPTKTELPDRIASFEMSILGVIMKNYTFTDYKVDYPEEQRKEHMKLNVAGTSFEKMRESIVKNFMKNTKRNDKI